MCGIRLDKSIEYRCASLRFFSKGEHHVSRICPDDVLLLVYDGILRFCEDGTQFEIHPGQYHIQRHGSVQSGEIASDAPKYLYVHFLAEWADIGRILPRNGTFEYARLKTIMDELDALAHSKSLYIAQAGKFYTILTDLLQQPSENPLACKIADYIAKEIHHAISLDLLCQEFHFSKNHIINTFRQTYGMTPIAYANRLRLQKAEYLIEVTSEPLESIASQCGFQNYSHFFKQFVRNYGNSPEKWRRQKRIRGGIDSSEATP